VSEPAAAERDPGSDLRPLLDEELGRLPDRYRAVLVLCDLEGKTRVEASRELGVPPGTVAGWLARARAMLAKRLTRRGVTLSAGALPGVVSQNVASAVVPAAVVASAIRTASLPAAGRAASAIPTEVAALTEGVLRAMTLAKLKVATALVLVVGLLAVGAGAALSRTTLAAQAAEPQAGGDKQKPDAGRKEAGGKKQAGEEKQKPGTGAGDRADKGAKFLITAKNNQVEVMALDEDGECRIVAERVVYEEGRKLVMADGEGGGKVLLSIRQKQAWFGVPKGGNVEEVRCDKLVFDRVSKQIQVTTGQISRVISTRENK